MALSVDNCNHDEGTTEWWVYLIWTCVACNFVNTCAVLQCSPVKISNFKKSYFLIKPIYFLVQRKRDSWNVQNRCFLATQFQVYHVYRMSGAAAEKSTTLACLATGADFRLALMASWSASTIFAWTSTHTSRSLASSTTFRNNSTVAQWDWLRNPAAGLRGLLKCLNYGDLLTREHCTSLSCRILSFWNVQTYSTCAFFGWVLSQDSCVPLSGP